MSARIIIAEDSAEIANLLFDFLTQEGHQVVLVENGLQLEEKAIQQKPHLIISDIQMPGGFGSTAYLNLQNNDVTSEIPIIFISAHPVGGMMPQDPKIRFIQKPVDLNVLAKTVHEMLPLGGYQP